MPRGPYVWKRPEGVPWNSPVPQWRWATAMDITDPNRDPHSPVARAVYRVMEANVPRDTQGNRIEPALVNLSYQVFQRKTGYSRSAIKKSIRELIRKHSIRAWQNGAEFVPKDGEAPTGRRRGDGGHRATIYHVRPYEMVISDRMKDAEIAHPIYKKTGKPQWFTLGRARRFITPAEAGNGPKGWNIPQFLDWVAERTEYKEQRVDARNAEEVGRPPQFPVPETASAAGSGPADQAAPQYQTENEAARPASTPAAAPTEDHRAQRPPQVVAAAVRRYCSQANNGQIWLVYDTAKATAKKLMTPISDEQIAQLVHETAADAKRDDNGQPTVGNFTYFLKALPDRIKNHPPYKRRPEIRVNPSNGRPVCPQQFWTLAESENEQERIEMAAQWYAVRELSDYNSQEWEQCKRLISDYERDQAIARADHLIGGTGNLIEWEESA